MTKQLASLLGEEGSPCVFRKVTDARGDMIQHEAQTCPQRHNEYSICFNRLLLFVVKKKISSRLQQIVVDSFVLLVLLVLLILHKSLFQQ